MMMRSAGNLREKAEITTYTLVTLGFVVMAAFGIYWWAANYSQQLRIFSQANLDAQFDNFNLLNEEVGKLLNSGDKVAITKMALRMNSEAAIVGWNPGTKVTYWSQNGNDRRTIVRPDVYCKSGCLCLYMPRSAWENEEKRHENVWCVEYGLDTYFYSRKDPNDRNKGYDYTLPDTVSDSRDYESLVLHGSNFYTKALTVEVQKIKGKQYVYIAELDTTEERS